MDGRHDIALIAKPHIPAAGEALARAFVDDPLCVYTQPDVAARISQFGWFFTKQVREAATQNGVYTNVLDDGPIGVAVWTPPRFADKAPRAAADNDTHDMERCFGIEASRRFSTHRHVEHVREKCMTDPHWYLVLLGVLPGARRQGIGQALLEPVLQIADEQDLPCYLETFIVDNVRFYERRGFEVVDSGVEPVSAIGYWAMKRKPGARTASNAAS